MKNIVVLASGSGSNLQAIIDSCESGYIKAKVAAVLSNKSDAYALTRAKNHAIDHHAVNAADFLTDDGSLDKLAFDQRLAEIIDQYQPDLVILAGYMRILSAEFVHRYQGKMLNIHPSLLPKYPGLHTYQRALNAGDSEHGTSVHFVTEQLDGGPIILQAKVPIFADDDEASLAKRVLVQEHAIYPLTIQWFIDGRLTMQSQQAYLDGAQLSSSGYAVD